MADLEDDAIDNDDLTSGPGEDAPQPPQATDAGPRVERLPKPLAKEPPTGEVSKPTRLVSDLRTEPEAPPTTTSKTTPEPAKASEPDELTKLREQHVALQERLERMEQAAKHPREPGELPPPEEVDPDDAETVRGIARSLMESRDVEAAQWRADYKRFGTELTPVTTELDEVSGDVLAIEHSLDDKKRESLGLPELDELARDGLRARLETLRSRQERLGNRRDQLKSKREALEDRYEQRMRGWVNDVRQTAANKRLEKKESESRDAEEVAADGQWTESWVAASKSLPEDVKDEVETYLLARADVVYNDLGRTIPDLRAWMSEKINKLLGARNVTAGMSDVEVARLRERDARQNAPRGRAAIAEPAPTRTNVTPEERRRDADRRTALAARSIRAVPR